MPDAPSPPPAPEEHPEVVYSAPTTEMVMIFARQVCRAMGEDYATPDTVNGLSSFIQVVADINVHQLNQSSGASASGLDESSGGGEVDKAD